MKYCVDQSAEKLLEPLTGFHNNLGWLTGL